MPQKRENAQDAKAEPTGDAVRRKVYQRPQLRVLGAVHQMTRGATVAFAFDGMAFRRTSSDRSVKQNIVRIGEHPLGIGMYLFDYKPEFRAGAGHGRQFGVMADEVEAILPEAVSVHPDGYKVVDYAMLGISRPAR